jgi:hypothetical protein
MEITQKSSLTVKNIFVMNKQNFKYDHYSNIVVSLFHNVDLFEI